MDVLLACLLQLEERCLDCGMKLKVSALRSHMIEACSGGPSRKHGRHSSSESDVSSKGTSGCM